MYINLMALCTLDYFALGVYVCLDSPILTIPAVEGVSYPKDHIPQSAFQNRAPIFPRYLRPFAQKFGFPSVGSIDTSSPPRSPLFRTFSGRGAF